MTESWNILTPSAYEPVSLDDAKTHCRITGSADDALLAIYIAAARKHVEDVSWRTLMPSIQTLTLDEWPDGNTIKLPHPPLQSVTHVKYTDSAGTVATLSSGSYVVDASSTPGRIRLKTGYSWPSVILREAGGIVVTYLAGVYNAVADSGNVTTVRAAVPRTHIAAMLLIIGHLYENREAVVVGSGLTATQLPIGIDSLLMPDRAFEF